MGNPFFPGGSNPNPSTGTPYTGGGTPVAPPPGGTRGKVPGVRQRVIIPNVDITGQINPNGLNALANDPARNQLMTASRDACVPILYGGPERLAGKLYIAKIYNTKLYVALIFCEGEVEQIGTAAGDTLNGIFVNDVDQAGSASIAVQKHVGTSGQAADTWLTAAITSPLAYTETLANTAYAVFEVQPGKFSGFPRIVATVKGRKVFDPRQNLLPWSNLFSSWTDVSTCGVAQDELGPYGATAYAWTLTDNNGAAHEGRTVAFTTVSGTTIYVWSVKVKKTSGGTSKTARVDANLGGGTGVNTTTLINTDSGATSGGTGVTVTDLGTFWLLSGTVTDNATGNNAFGMTVYPAVAPNGSFTQAVATQGSAVFCEGQIRKSTVSAGYVETPTATAVDQPTVWSDNTALCLGDYLASAVYGENRTVDAASLCEAAEVCDRSMGASLPGTYTWAANVVTVTATAHGVVNGTGVYLAFTSGAATPGGLYTATVTGANTYTVPLTGSGAGGNVTWWKSNLNGVNEKRSRITLVLDSRQPTKSWRDILRAYVPCWVVIDGSTAYLKVDKAGTSDHTFTSANIDTAQLPTLKRSGVRDTPTVVTIGYTDISVTPWKIATADADTGAANRRKTRIDMPGIRTYSQARRFAIERLNHYTLEDLSGEISVFEDGLKVLQGDLATITDDIGMTAKVVRVLGAADQGHGRWRLRFREYQAGAYSNVVETSPTASDMLPPDPNAPPAITGLALTEDRRLESGVWVSRIRATWNPVTSWPFVQGYIVELFDPSNSATYAWGSGVVEVSSAAHGLAVNEVVYLDFTSGPMTTDGSYSVTSIVDPNTYRTLVPGGPGTTGNVTWRKMREHEIVTAQSWLSAPVLLDVQYSVRVRIYSMSNVVGP